MNKMTPFNIYRSRGHQYLAVTATIGLRIEGRRLGKTLYRLRKPVAVKGASAQLIIEQPGASREDDAFKTNVKAARAHWVQIGMTGGLEARRLFFHEVLACCSYFNKKSMKQYDLRDVARLIGIKSFATYYKVLHLEARRQLQGKDKAVAAAKDLTLIQSVNNYRKLWPSIIGFSKPLDANFKYELKLYTSAMRARSLSLEAA